MALSIPVTWSEAHRRHAPETGVWLGVAIAADELPARADHIRSALEAAGATLVEAEPHVFVRETRCKAEIEGPWDH